MIEITKDNIKVADLEVNKDFTGVDSYIETYFDVDEKFGVNTLIYDDMWLDLYAEYRPKEKSFRLIYIINEPTGDTEYSYVPTDGEKNTIISLMEQFAQDNYGINISKIIEAAKNSKW